MRDDRRTKRSDHGGVGRGGTIRRTLAVVGGLALLLAIGVSTFGLRDRHVEAANDKTSAAPLTAQQVVAAFQAEGLTVENVRRDPQGMGGPSGPPMTESEAWSFSIPGNGPSGGRIMIFADDDKRDKKHDWFKRVGAESKVVAHKNVVLWLDSRISPSETARYRKALKGLV